MLALFHQRALVTLAVKLAMMDAAQRHRELIRYPAAECARLREPKMVSLAGLPATQGARLTGNEAKMIFVATSGAASPRRGYRLLRCVFAKPGVFAVRRAQERARQLVIDSQNLPIRAVARSPRDRSAGSDGAGIRRIGLGFQHPHPIPECCFDD